MHATIYVLVITTLITVNLVFVPQFLWAAFPAAGWGIGLFMHYRFGVRHAAEQLTVHHARVNATSTQRRTQPSQPRTRSAFPRAGVRGPTLAESPDSTA